MDLSLSNAIFESSKTIIGWSLSLIGGSIVVILGTDYLRPQKLLGRLVYLLFLPGWYFLMKGIMLGNDIANRWIMSFAMKDTQETLIEISEKMRNCYMSQIQSFSIGIIFFGIWLVIHLLTWIFLKTK